ncbi:NADH-ubiquinone/plastoquinone (complex I), subunit [delta proteobacterium NaphS2]|nr:NADH-ubiquinone/plastoquinone (complex I), subunit [delta proteobacterium NaphS2]
MVILPEIILAFGGLLIFSVGAFGRRGTGQNLFVPALIFLGATIIACFLVPFSNPFLSRMLTSNSYTRLFMVLIASIAFLCVLFSYRYAKTKGFNNDAFFGVLLFAAFGMDLTARAAHWLIFFLGLELLSISLYILIAIRRDDPFKGEAAIKYLITGAVAGAFLVFGIGLWYAGTGSLSLMIHITSDSIDTSLMMAALALILVGIGFKISFAPFHLWTPDVYQGSPAPVTAFLATGSKVAVFAFLIRLCLELQPPLWEPFKTILWITAFLTLVAGTVTALSQTRLESVHK